MIAFWVAFWLGIVMPPLVVCDTTLIIFLKDGCSRAEIGYQNIRMIMNATTYNVCYLISIHKPPDGSITKQLVTVWNDFFLQDGLQVAINTALLAAA